MSLSKEERIELVLLSGREGWSYRQIANDFNARHPRMTPIFFGTVGKVVRKFKETGSVLDKPRSGRPTVMDDKTREAVIAKVTARPKNSIHMTSLETGYSSRNRQKDFKSREISSSVQVTNLAKLNRGRQGCLVTLAMTTSITVGRQERGLSKTLPVSLNFLTSFPTVPKKMGVILG
jgi:transposase